PLPQDPLGDPISNGYWYQSDGQSAKVYASLEEDIAAEQPCPTDNVDLRKNYGRPRSAGLRRYGAADRVSLSAGTPGGDAMSLDLFNRRAREDREKHGDRLPPGQKLTDGWPVLHYGGIPAIDLATWKFSVVGEVEQEAHFTWD